MKINGTECAVMCMKWGKAFSSLYVNNLLKGVKRFMPHIRFVCLTDDKQGLDESIEIYDIPPLPAAENHTSPWRKISSFASLKGLEGVRILFLDLDVVVLQDLSDFFRVTSFGIIENWTQKGRGIGNSSAYVFTSGEHTYLYDQFYHEAQKYLTLYDNEQTYVSKEIKSAVHFFDTTWCLSFKRHCLHGRLGRLWREPKAPHDDAKLLCFHGHPRPHEALEGKYPTRLIPFIRKARWLEHFWSSATK